MSPSLDRLHPALVHHIVNSLGWPALRPLQNDAIGPVMDGHDCLLLAATAGGKTEAAAFPVLSRMVNGGWHGVSVLYVCPLRALLNNLQPRLEQYTHWLGRQVGLWHGDVGASQRRRLLADPPDMLLTTPESLEAMLVSTRVDERDFFSGLRVVIVDEVHAFAGGDRGWHLLAVLERLEVLAGRPLQRVGLSATIGNPAEILTWLQGSGSGFRPGEVVGGSGTGPFPPPGEVALDHVRTISNAAAVIDGLHPGRKRLVFSESRAGVEHLTTALRERGVTTFASHSSLSRDTRHQAELAFTTARDCVIVATSTLELGVDIGDLDHVLQIDSPLSVASFLQRLGRTGRRADTTRNATFLTIDEDDLVTASALLVLWSEGYVEPVLPPPDPRHVGMQQLLALCLQEGRVGSKTWASWLRDSPVVGQAAALTAHALATGLVDIDGGMLHIGPEAESRYGRRHFMDLVATFTAGPEFTVFEGNRDLGQVALDAVTEAVPADQQRRLSLGGQAWMVTYVDWKRRRCFVERATGAGKTSFARSAGPGLSFALSQARRRVLLGADAPVQTSARATAGLVDARAARSLHVAPERLVVERRDRGLWWWTFAGSRANATLRASVPELVDPHQGAAGEGVRLRADLTPRQFGEGVAAVLGRPLRRPLVDRSAMKGLKFADVLPEDMAIEVLGARLGDEVGATWVLQQATVWR